MKIEQLHNHDQIWIAEVAALLVENFPHSWPNESLATREVMGCLEPGKIALVAVEEKQLSAEKGTVVGIVGAMPQYGATAWELHPLSVAKACQHQGIGTQLVKAIEKEVADHGCITLYAGTDDEFGRTSLANCDLYDGLWERISHIQNLKRHPYEFYLKLGYQIVGVIPDANGLGKPDIWVARRIGPVIRYSGNPSL